MSVEVSIICDGCAALITAAKSAAAARAELKQMGGMSRSPHDVCPPCVKKGVRP